MSTQTVQFIPTKNIILDAGTQSRLTLDQGVIQEYSQALKEAIITAKAVAVAAGQPEKDWDEAFENPFPPVEATRDPSGHIYLTDGFHRIFAHKDAGIKDIPAEITEGTLRDAILASVSANSDHGVRRTQKDKRRATLTLLDDEEWVQWSDVEIAKRARVSPFMVAGLRKPTAEGSPTTRKVTRAGKTSTVKTGRIGKKQGKSPKPETTGKAGKAKGDNGPGIDRETEVAISKIVNAVGAGPNAAEGGKLRKAIETGALELSPKDLRAWAQTSDARIRKAHPLIVENAWNPVRAFAFLDRELTADSKVSDLINHATARGGAFSIKIDGFHFTVESEKARKASTSSAATARA